MIASVLAHRAAALSSLKFTLKDPTLLPLEKLTNNARVLNVLNPGVTYKDRKKDEEPIASLRFMFRDDAKKV